jgi:hypothetical protein
VRWESGLPVLKGLAVLANPLTYLLVRWESGLPVLANPLT